MDSIDIDTQEVYDAEMYITSKASNRITLDCIETTPPLHPYDFNITYDYQNDAPRLTWAFPPNTQQDIKFFQIFKRNSVDEPFQLIKQYDFNDSDVSYGFDSFVDTGLVEKMTSAKTYYIDYDFKRSTQGCIYAICCVDAHGMSSGYSMQLQVSYDNYKNALKSDMVSSFGAPKQYPNMFVDEDMFVDVVKTTNYKKCHLYFEPEFLEIYDSTNGQELGLLSTDKKDGKYILKIINTDNQKQQNVEIILHDKRN